MAGIQNNLMYDEKTTQQDTNQSTALYRNYFFLKDAFENDLTTNTLSSCDGKFAHLECNMCKFNEDTMTNTRENIAYRIEVENDLQNTTRLLSGSDATKYIPCFAREGKEGRCDNLNNKGDYQCGKYVGLRQPFLCDRLIAPTNMRQFKSGFEY